MCFLGNSPAACQFQVRLGIEITLTSQETLYAVCFVIRFQSFLLLSLVLHNCISHVFADVVLAVPSQRTCFRALAVCLTLLLLKMPFVLVQNDSNLLGGMFQLRNNLFLPLIVNYLATVVTKSHANTVDLFRAAALFHRTFLSFSKLNCRNPLLVANTNSLLRCVLQLHANYCSFIHYCQWHWQFTAWKIA